MIDLETFRTTRYVMIDECCQVQWKPEQPKPGAHASVSRSEELTLALCGQGVHCPSERAFSRDAEHHLRNAFPQVPTCSPFNRVQRSHRDEITAFALFLVQLLHAQETADDVLDSTAAVTRDATRRGLGWLAGQAAIGWSNRVGWSEGFHLLLGVTDQGVMTGCGFGSASPHDQHLAATVCAARHTPSPRLPRAGLPTHGSSVAEKGFAGDRPRQQWKEHSQVDVVTPPHHRSTQRWPKALRRWLASVRHISETVNDTLVNTFRLAREHPHDVTGFQARLAAKGAVHHVCIWFNVHLDRAPFAFAAVREWEATHRNSHQRLEEIAYEEATLLSSIYFQSWYSDRRVRDSCQSAGGYPGESRGGREGAGDASRSRRPVRPDEKGQKPPRHRR
jgi:hypothetical protein